MFPVSSNQKHKFKISRIDYCIRQYFVCFKTVTNYNVGVNVINCGRYCVVNTYYVVSDPYGCTQIILCNLDNRKNHLF